MRPLAIACAVLALFPAFLLADDINPPAFRGAPGSTVQHWDFSTGATGLAPDALPLFNPHGTAQLIPGNVGNWLPSWFGRNDVWIVNDFDLLRFQTPSAASASLQVWVQVTYYSGPGTIGTAVTDPVNFNPGVWAGFPQTVALGNGWFHKTELYQFTPGPGFTTLTISPPIPGTAAWVDQVVIDTLVVPAPASASLLALGMIASARRRRAR